MIKTENMPHISMNDKTLYIVYAVLFFSILIPLTLILLSEDNSKSLNPKVSVTMIKITPDDPIYPIQAFNVGPIECSDKLMNNLQSGNFDFDKLQEGMDKCLQLDLNNDSGNNTKIIPELHEENNLHIV
jgi:hypothetical protein